MSVRAKVSPELRWILTSPVVRVPVARVSEAATPPGVPMVRLENWMAIAEALTLAAMPMETESFLPGTPEGLQLPAVFQRVVPPIQDFGEIAVELEPAKA